MPRETVLGKALNSKCMTRMLQDSVRENQFTHKTFRETENYN